MKVVRFCIFLLASTVVFASCKPNGSENSHDTLAGTPSKADTVVPHKYHMAPGDTIKGEDENLPARLKR